MIVDLSLAIALWIVEGGELVGDLVFGTKTCHLLAGEICPIVEDDGIRESKVTYDVLPEELDYLLFRDVGEWHRLYPLGEVVCGYQ